MRTISDPPSQDDFIDAYRMMHPDLDAEFARAVYASLQELQDEDLLETLVEATMEEVKEQDTL